MSFNIKPVTEEEKAQWPKSVLVELDAPHTDERGDIQPILDAEMQSCVIITSRKGATRANHYHKTDWHYCYVMSGSIEYYHRPTGSDKEPEMVLVKKGQMMFTPPMVDHAMYFPEESTFLTLGRNPRAQSVYEADVRRIKMFEKK